MTRVAPWVQKITEKHFGAAPFKVGDVVPHSDGRMVKILNGQYWGEFGISNFWNWQEVKNGKLVGKIESGYGWRPEKSTKKTNRKNNKKREGKSDAR